MVGQGSGTALALVADSPVKRMRSTLLPLAHSTSTCTPDVAAAMRWHRQMHGGQHGRARWADGTVWGLHRWANGTEVRRKCLHRPAVAALASLAPPCSCLLAPAALAAALELLPRRLHQP